MYNPPCMYIAIYVGRAEVASFDLKEGVNTIGLSTDIDLVLYNKNEQIAARHATITVTGDSAVLEDLGSPAGTSMIGGFRVLPGKPFSLQPYDEILIGGNKLIFFRDRSQSY